MNDAAIFIAFVSMTDTVFARLGGHVDPAIIGADAHPFRLDSDDERWCTVLALTEVEPMIGEFRGFLIKANAIALAIGVVLGAAVAKLVGAVADDVLMPIIGLVLPGGNWREARIVLSSTTDAAGKVTENAILYGHLLGALIDFLIVAFVIFLVVKWLIKEELPPA